MFDSSARIKRNRQVKYLDQDRFKLVVRDDMKVLGQVGARHTIVQPYDTFNWFNPLIESGLVELESGGSLNDGARLWALARIKNAECDVIKNDPVRGYFLLADSFDGSLPNCASFTDIRVVCANTLGMAIGTNGKRAQYKHKHTKSIHTKLDALKASVKGLIEQFHTRVEAYQSLTVKRFTDNQLTDYVKHVFEIDTENEELHGKTQTKIDRVIELAEVLPEREHVPANRGTVWNAFNAVTNYLQHESGQNENTRVNSLWFGQNAKTSQRALQLAFDA